MADAATESWLNGKNRAIHMASLWQITRRDGTVLRFTDHNKQISYEGNTFTPFNGLDASARQRNADTEHSNLDVIGIISDATVTDAELAGGLWAGARIEEIVVDWRVPWVGYARRDVYIVTEIKRVSGESWTAKLQGLTRMLESKVGIVYTRNCRHRLGDSNCAYNIASLAVAGTVTAVEADESFRVFQADGALETPHALDITWFDWGNVTWVTGDNVLSGTLGKMEVKRARRPSAPEDIRIELQLDMPFEIQVGDTFTITPGCDKTLATCAAKFSNVLKFGGFPHIPGPDRMLQSPRK